MAALEQQPLLTDGHRRDGRAFEEFRNVCESAPHAMGRPLAACRLPAAADRLPPPAYPCCRMQS